MSSADLLQEYLILVHLFPTKFDIFFAIVALASYGFKNQTVNLIYSNIDCHNFQSPNEKTAPNANVNVTTQRRSGKLPQSGLKASQLLKEGACKGVLQL